MWGVAVRGGTAEAATRDGAAGVGRVAVQRGWRCVVVQRGWRRVAVQRGVATRGGAAELARGDDLPCADGVALMVRVACGDLLARRVELPLSGGHRRR